MRARAAHSASVPFNPSSSASPAHAGEKRADGTHAVERIDPATSMPHVCRMAGRGLALASSPGPRAPGIRATRAKKGAERAVTFSSSTSGRLAINHLGKKNLSLSCLLFIALHFAAWGLEQRIDRRRTEVRKRIRPLHVRVTRSISLRRREVDHDSVFDHRVCGCGLHQAAIVRTRNIQTTGDEKMNSGKDGLTKRTFSKWADAQAKANEGSKGSNKRHRVSIALLAAASLLTMSMSASAATSPVALSKTSGTTRVNCTILLNAPTFPYGNGQTATVGKIECTSPNTSARLNITSHNMRLKAWKRGESSNYPGTTSVTSIGPSSKVDLLVATPRPCVTGATYNYYSTATVTFNVFVGATGQTLAFGPTDVFFGDYSYRARSANCNP